MSPRPFLMKMSRHSHSNGRIEQNNRWLAIHNRDEAICLRRLHESALFRHENVTFPARVCPRERFPPEERELVPIIHFYATSCTLVIDPCLENNDPVTNACKTVLRLRDFQQPGRPLSRKARKQILAPKSLKVPFGKRETAKAFRCFTTDDQFSSIRRP